MVRFLAGRVRIGPRRVEASRRVRKEVRIGSRRVSHTWARKRPPPIIFKKSKIRGRVKG